MTGLANYYFVPSLRQGLAAAIPEKDQDDNPVIFIEHQLLYNVKGPVPNEDYVTSKK